MSPILCPHCGTANRAGSNFCNRCGASLRNEPLPPPADRGPGVSPPAQDPGPSAEQPPTVPSEFSEQGQPPRSAGTQPSPEEPAAGASAAQPWLQPDFVGEDDVPLEPDELAEDVDAGIADTTDIPVAAGRLVSGIQGLIEPIRVATVPGEGNGEPPTSESAVELLDADRLRRVRALMTEEPLLAAGIFAGTFGSTPLAAAVPPRRHFSLWIPWVFLVIGMAVAIPVFLQVSRTTGTALAWPGVRAAYAAIDSLPPQATVQVFWAYDPATAGELDLLSAPIVRHLLTKGAKLRIVSLLPNGPATARRLLAAVRDEQSQLRRGAGEAVTDPPRFLPGGVMVLPILGQEQADLAVVFAAQAEDAQAWLEQVAPRSHVPVVAATGAGADPLLRPYLASGQLIGLVSGYDGAATYTAMLDEPPTRAREQQLQIQLVGQNLATVAFLLLILAGNVAILVTGRRGDA